LRVMNICSSSMRRLSTLAINLIAWQNSFDVSAWAIILAYSICFVSSSESSRSRRSSWASKAASARWVHLNCTSARARLRAKISAKVSTSSIRNFASGLLKFGVQCFHVSSFYCDCRQPSPSSLLGYPLDWPELLKAIIIFFEVASALFQCPNAV
jgi:hypothetical protein